MREVQAVLNEDIHLGRRGENLATCVTFDVSEWQGAGEGTVHLLHQRNGDMHPYPCAITVENGVVTWIITASDVEFAGRGKAELQYLDGEVCIKSAVFTTKTLRALGRAGEEPPAPHEGWVHKVLEAAGDTEGWAEEADASARSARASATQARDAAQTAATDAANAAAGMAAQQAAEQAVGQAEGRLSGHVADAQSAAQQANQSAQAASQSVSVAHDHAGDALWAANQAQKAATQAKDDADRAEAAAEREFLAVYGETSFADIEAAIAAGRAVYLLEGERKVPLSFITDMGEYKDASFYHYYGVFYSSFYVRSDTNEWWKRTDALQDASDKVQSITSESAVNQYPSAKAVYEYGQTLEKTFTAKFGETTLAEVEAAYAEGKTLFCVWDGNLYCQATPTSTAFFFEGVFGNTKRKLSLNRANGRWMDITPTTILTSGNISFDVYDADDQDEVVPSVKAVYDADKVITDSVKPYTDYWWYAPGKGEQDGYEQKVEESVTITDAFGTGGIRGEEKDMPIPVYYGDSISYDKVTGKYAINGATMLTSNPNKFTNDFNTVLKNKFVAIFPSTASSNLSSIAYISEASTLTKTTERDGAIIEYFYTLVGATQYTSAPHAGDYISSPDKTTYEGVEGYTLLGTVQEQVLDMQENGTGGDSNVFLAKYGVTTYTEIEAAVAEGKAVLALYGKSVLPLVGFESERIYFSAPNGLNIIGAVCSVDNSWYHTGMAGEHVANKTSLITSQSTGTEYPSAKAVYDFVQSVGAGVYYIDIVEAEDGSYTTDVDIIDIGIAYSSGRALVVRDSNGLLYANIGVVDGGFVFAVMPDLNNSVLVIISADGVQVVQSTTQSITVGDVSWDGTEPVDFTEAVRAIAQEGGTDGADNVFVAEYGVTTREEIVAAVEAGKAVFCLYNDVPCALDYVEATSIYFFGIRAFRIYRPSLANNHWTFSTDGIERTSQKVKTISDASTDSQYPSAKAVYDLVSPLSEDIGDIDTALDSILAIQNSYINGGEGA